MRFLTLWLLLSSVPAAAQQTRQLTADDYTRAERFLVPNTAPLVSGTAGRPNWLPDGRVWYRATTDRGAQFIMVDPKRGTRNLAFDHTRLATALTSTLGSRVEPTQLPFNAFQFAQDGRSITMTASGRRLTCSIQTYECSPADSTRAPGARAFAAPASSVTSPDGKYAAFIRDFNLWVKDLGTNQDRQLTTDGIKDFGYATNNAGWVRSDLPVLLWSPDSKKIATFQHDGRGVSDMYLVSTNVGAPRLSAWKYPLPQDSVIFRIHRVVIEVEPARVVRLQLPPDQHRSTISDHIASGSTFLDVEWFPDATQLAFVSSSRDHKEAIFRVANATTGQVRTLFQERSRTQFQSGFAEIGSPNWRVLHASREVLWWSQRDGWAHLYLYDLNSGALKQQVTSGAWNVAEVLNIDEKRRLLHFTGVGREPGRDPYFLHLYRSALDGKGLALLTPDNANHTITLSPDAQYFVDTYSTPSTPPVSVLRGSDGKQMVALEKTDISRLLATGWKPPTPITVKARDGRTDLYGLMWTPTQLDSSRKYPVVNYIYPGPWGRSVFSRSFIPAHGDNQAMAELGFVVVAIDGMGTEMRSKEFADFYYGNMGDNTIPDQIAGMRELASRYRFIDIDKAGIWGHSGGGFATASAMFRHPDFFKVGVSQSGNHDNRNYEDDWGERFQGLLQRSNGGDNYESQANQLAAKNLKGKLMLAHGGMDDNVPPYNTYLVADALVKAGKDFDLVILPNQTHGYGVDNNYMTRRRWDYFVRYLLGAEPPREFQIGRPRT
ncbi:MAG: DPP IV N-terminal domain-containing protein [Pseudomonas sp.]